jgi:hypothetical protein
MNPKAKEAFAKSQIDIGVSIFKSIMILVTTLPLALFLKASFDGNKSGDLISIVNVIQSFSLGSQILIGFLFFSALFMGHNLRRTGIKILNEMESET